MASNHCLSRRELLAAAAATSTLLATAPSAIKADQSKPRIRVGQIGVAHAHATKLSVYRDSADYEVVGIVEPNDTLRRRARTEEPFRDLTWMTQEQLLNVPDLQVVLVETEVRDLLSTAEACVAAGKHIHLDKPAGESLPHFMRIIDSARRQQLQVQLGYMYRYNPAVILLRQFLQQGWLGDVFEVHAVMSKVVDNSSRRDLAHYSGGIMFELGCHIIDLVVKLLGEPPQISDFRQHVAYKDDQLLDNMLAVYQYPRALASVKSSAQEVEGFARRHLVVCGTEGTFHIQPLDDPVARVALSTPRGTYQAGYQEVKFPEFVRYVADAKDMSAIVRGEKECDFPYDYEVAVQRTLLKSCGLPID